MPRYLLGFPLAVLLTIGAVSTRASGAPPEISYSYSTLEVPGSVATEAYDINDSGDIVGLSSTGEIGNAGRPHAFLYVNGTFTTIDIPGGIDSLAYGINNRDEIVGDYTKPPEGYPAHSFLWSNGTFTLFDVPGSSGTHANGINDAGQIVGAYADNLETHGFVWSDDTFTTIDVPGANGTFANGINNRGQIVGGFFDIHGAVHGFLLDNGIFTTFDVPGNLRRINDRGQMVGDYGNASLLLSNGTLQPIDPPGTNSSSAGGVNNRGQVVGFYRTPSEPLFRGFVATPATPRAR